MSFEGMKLCDEVEDGWNTRKASSNEHLEKRWSTIDELKNGASRIKSPKIHTLVNEAMRSVWIWPCIHYRPIRSKVISCGNRMKVEMGLTGRLNTRGLPPCRWQNTFVCFFHLNTNDSLLQCHFQWLQDSKFIPYFEERPRN